MVMLLLAGTTLMRGAVTAATPPAGPGAMGSSLCAGPHGSLYLSWLEPAGNGQWAMKLSHYEPASDAWSPVRTIVSGAELFPNWADFPQLAISTTGRLTAVWSVNNPAHHAVAGHHGAGYRAIYAHSSDEGRTWTPDLPVSDESLPVEFVTLHPLPDGRMLAAWLDGRAHLQGVDRSAVYARVLDAPGADVLVDGSVCDCCQLSFAAGKSGPLLAYRHRTSDEVRDIHLASFDGRAWRRQGSLHADGWKIAGCPVNGPQLAAEGSRVGAVWFTAAGNQARVLASVSPDGGKSFGSPVTVDLGHPEGRVDNVLLADGTMVMTWLETAGPDKERAAGIYLRTLGPDGALSAPRLIAATRGSRASGFPRIARLGGRQLLLTCTQDGETTRVLAFRIDLD